MGAVVIARATLPSSVAVVGAGRLGTAVTRALQAAGIRTAGPLRRGERAAAELTLLCVPDDQIGDVAATVAGSCRLVGHVSGVTALADLDAAGVPALGMHPLQTFSGGDGADRFNGIGCAVAGTNAEALAVAGTLATALGMRPFEIAERDRAAYHAAACLASNYVLTVLDAAERTAAAAGLDGPMARTAFAPLVRTSVDNWVRQGAVDALTGPIARGDRGTVAAHRASVRAHVPELTGLLDELVAGAESLGARRESGPAQQPIEPMSSPTGTQREDR